MSTTDLDHRLEMAGARLRYADSVVGQPLLLRSGGHGLRDYLGSFANSLASHVRVIRMDPRGCGDSTSDGQYDDDITVQDIENLRTHLGIERWNCCLTKGDYATCVSLCRLRGSSVTTLLG